MNDCILWDKGQSMGYGITSRFGKIIRAHQVAWIYAFGPIPEGMDIHHKCKVRLCINPDHLELLTKSAHSALHNPPKLVCDKCGSVRTLRRDRNVYRCLTCHAAKQRQRNKAVR